MTNKETVERNIGLTFDFVKFLIDNPKHIEKLPDKFVLDFVEKDFTKKTYKPKHTFKQRKSTFVKVRNTFEFASL